MTLGGVLVDQDLVQGLVAADGDVLLDVVGVDQAAVAQDDLDLAVEERDLVPVGHVRVAGAVLDVAGEVVPLLDLAQDVSAGGMRPSVRPLRMAPT